MKASLFVFKLGLLIVLFLPGSLIVLDLTSSSGPGLFLASLFLLAVCVTISYVGKFTISLGLIKYLLVVFFFIILHSIGVYYIFDVDLDFSKLIVSLLLVLLVLILTRILSLQAKIIDDLNFLRVIKFISYILAVLGVVTISFRELNISQSKSMFFFSEPSHYILVLLPFTLFYMIKQASVHKVFFLVFILIVFSLLIESVLSVFGVIFLIYIRFYYSAFVRYIFPLIVLLIFYGVSISNNEFYEYYSSRVSLTSDSTNLTALVYMSGWERVYIGILESYGFGFGFQQMGIAGPSGEFRSILNGLNAHGLNLTDGSFLFSKLVFEFGAIGLIVTLFYLLSIHKFIKILHGNMGNKIVFFCSVYLCFFLYLFLRGGGYFMPFVALFLISVFFLKGEKAFAIFSSKTR
ncbi:hypothetical protein [Opacimonas viscosa]|uniref:Uncharacterized protein n=1 Tax=Opacimonas viscosa TaxID=2961944 RepID=A0AA41X3E1_9ALTE|nr:hypothetical protein [Opacimonas viscosa]MCP3429122.1 hypothetical protein [Opacimonas viscosa]